MGDDNPLDWYYDSDSTSQTSRSYEWQNFVDPKGSVFFVRRLSPQHSSATTSRYSSSSNVNCISKTPSGFLDKLKRKSGHKVARDKDELLNYKQVASHTKERFEKSTNCGILYTSLNLTEDSINENNVIYAYPPSDNILSTARGLFITLLHLIPSFASSCPEITSFVGKKCKINVAYYYEGKDVLLLALPEPRYSGLDCRRILRELAHYQKLIFQTLTRCYATPIDNFSDLDSFFGTMFRKLQQTDSSNTLGSLHNSFTPSVPYMVVPKDVHLQIEESLNEFESNEIKYLGNRRRFSIIGTAYFYKGCAVCSHLCKDSQLEAFILMRETGIYQHMIDGVKELVYWKEIFPASYCLGPEAAVAYPKLSGRWFFLIVAMGNNLLVTLLESGGCTVKAPVNPGPDPLFVQEAQDTLRHIIKLGMAHFSTKWLSSFKTGDRIAPSEGNLSLCRSVQSLSSSYNDNGVQGSIKSFDLTDFDASEDHLPVLGRRAERQLNEITYLSSPNLTESLGEMELIQGGKTRDNPFEGSDFGRSTPVDVSISHHRTGENKFDQYFHYVHIDSSEGIIITNLSTDTPCATFTQVMENFRVQVMVIQEVFRSASMFQNKSSDLGKIPLNKSMVAIKEFGTLFEVDDAEDKSNRQSYWVIGRLMFNPVPRELYVCYQDSCPQNLVEMAFQSSLNSSR